MTLSELILLIHWEVQKSFNLIDDLAKSNSSTDTVNIHLGIDKFEMTIPISIKEHELYYEEINKMIKDERFRKFYYPLIIQSDAEIKGKVKGIIPQKKGKVLDVAVRSTFDNQTHPNEKIGEMSITFIRTQS